MEGDCNVYAHSLLWMCPTRPDRDNMRMVYWSSEAFESEWKCYSSSLSDKKTLVFKYEFSLSLNENATARPRILDVLVLQDKTLFCLFEAGDIVFWLVSLPIAKLDLFKSADCHWICKTYGGYCYRNSATVLYKVQLCNRHTRTVSNASVFLSLCCMCILVCEPVRSKNENAHAIKR